MKYSQRKKDSIPEASQVHPENDFLKKLGKHKSCYYQRLHFHKLSVTVSGD